jgi:hypothetical protein
VRATERERERAERLEGHLDDARRDLVIAQAEAATVPALKDTISALKTALEGAKARLAEVRANRDRLAARPWWRRLVG